LSLVHIKVVRVFSQNILGNHCKLVVFTAEFEEVQFRGYLTLPYTGTPDDATGNAKATYVEELQIQTINPVAVVECLISSGMMGFFQLAAVIIKLKRKLIIR